MAESAEFIGIQDFTLGIFSDYHSQSGAAATGSDTSSLKNGAATIENTYRCVASPDGVLGPLPRVITPAAGAGRPAPPASAANNYAAGMEAWYVTDAVVFGPIGTQAIGIYDLLGDEAVVVATAYGANFLLGGGANKFQYAFVYEQRCINTAAALRATAVTAFERSVAGGIHPIIPPGGLEKSRTGGETATYPVPADALPFTLAHMFSFSDLNAQNGAVGTNDTDMGVTYPGVNYIVRAVGQRGGVALIHAFAPFATLVNNVMAASTAAATVLDAGLMADRFRWMVGHQGRLVVGMELDSYIGIESITYGSATVGGDVILYSHSQLLQHTTFPGSLAAFVEENSSGYGAFASLSSNELFLVKNYGGAVLVRGDLDNPTVIRLPKVDSTHGILYRGVITPLGFVYCSRNGIYLWDNGDSSQHLSPQLDGYFFNHLDSAEIIGGIKGRLAYWHPFVAVPNNYLFDTRTGSWWRLDLPTGAASSPDYDAFNCYDVSPQTGHMFAFPYKIRAGTTDTPPWHIFRHDTLASTWSWQSQPLLESRDKRLNYSDVRLIAQRAPNSTGTCTVTVTLTGVNETGVEVTPVVTVFTLTANDNPQYLIQAISPNFVARWVKVRIEASAAGGPAPKVYVPLLFAVHEDVMAVRA